MNSILFYIHFLYFFISYKKIITTTAIVTVGAKHVLHQVFLLYDPCCSCRCCLYQLTNRIEPDQERPSQIKVLPVSHVVLLPSCCCCSSGKRIKLTARITSRMSGLTMMTTATTTWTSIRNTVQFKREGWFNAVYFFYPLLNFNVTQMKKKLKKI